MIQKKLNEINNNNKINNKLIANRQIIRTPNGYDNMLNNDQFEAHTRKFEERLMTNDVFNVGSLLGVPQFALIKP